MKLKKINAALGLLSILFMLLHIGYSVFCYLTFYYNPVLKMVFAIPFMVLVCLHAVCGMLTVFTMKDGSRMDIRRLYGEHFGSTCSKSLSCMDVCPMKIPTIASMAKMNR